MRLFILAFLESSDSPGLLLKQWPKMIEFSLGKACPCCLQTLWGAGNTKPKNDTVVLAFKIIIYGVHKQQQWQRRGAAARAQEAKSKGSPKGSNLETIRADGVGRNGLPNMNAEEECSIHLK